MIKKKYKQRKSWNKFLRVEDVKKISYNKYSYMYVYILIICTTVFYVTVNVFVILDGVLLIFIKTLLSVTFISV